MRWFEVDEDEEYRELMMSNQEMDDMVDRSFDGLRGTPTADGGMLIEIGNDPAGEGPVNVLPMFMARPAGTDFAQAIEMQDMGEFGKPKVPRANYPDYLRNRRIIEQAMEDLHDIHANWPVMLIVRWLERVGHGGLLPQDKDAAAALIEAAEAAADRIRRG